MQYIDFLTTQKKDAFRTIIQMCKNKVKVIETGALRSAGSASITAPTKWVGDTVGIFIMATDYTSENPQPNLTHPSIYTTPKPSHRIISRNYFAGNIDFNKIVYIFGGGGCVEDISENSLAIFETENLIF